MKNNDHNFVVVVVSVLVPALVLALVAVPVPVVLFALVLLLLSSLVLLLSGLALLLSGLVLVLALLLVLVLVLVLVLDVVVVVVVVVVVAMRCYLLLFVAAVTIPSIPASQPRGLVSSWWWHQPLRPRWEGLGRDPSAASRRCFEGHILWGDPLKFRPIWLVQLIDIDIDI